MSDSAFDVGVDARPASGGFRPTRLNQLAQLLASSPEEDRLEGTWRPTAKVNAVSGMEVSLCDLPTSASLRQLVMFADGGLGEITKLTETGARVVAFDSTDEVRIGERAALISGKEPLHSHELAGRCVDGLGRPIDGLPLPASVFGVTGVREPEPSGRLLGRPLLSEPLQTRITVIDAFVPLCYGQRVGVFAGSGVGKSTLLAMLAKAPGFSSVVVALVGERAREVGEFVRETLDEETRKRAIVVVATGDESAPMRRRAPELAMNIARKLAHDGGRVLLLVDSLTRYAHALREIGISNGEAPVAHGYPPSVFAALPRLIEKAGAMDQGGGSITMIATVLVDGDDHAEPVADAARGILDGHIVLDRTIAEAGRYPPVDPLASVSRSFQRIVSAEDAVIIQKARSAISRFERSSDLRQLGGYVRGQDKDLDLAVEAVPRVYAALNQSPDEFRNTDAVAALQNALSSLSSDRSRENLRRRSASSFGKEEPDAI